MKFSNRITDMEILVTTINLMVDETMKRAQILRIGH